MIHSSFHDARAAVLLRSAQIQSWLSLAGAIGEALVAVLLVTLRPSVLVGLVAFLPAVFFAVVGVIERRRIEPRRAMVHQELSADADGIRRHGDAHWETTWDAVERVQLLVGRSGTTCIVIEKPGVAHRRENARLFAVPIAPPEALACGITHPATEELVGLLRSREVACEYRDLRLEQG